MAGQYKGSQAFNQIDPFADESVNPNTGSLNLSVPLVKLQGKRNGIELNLSLFYSAGFRGTFGLPHNWGLNLPYVLGQSVTTNSRTYVIDPEWTDDTKYQSGLRYTNNHGIKFETVSPPHPLPSGLHGEYVYKLKNADGSVDFFDIKGKPIEHHDIYGNFLRYTFATGEESGIDDSLVRVDEIMDSWGQIIKFSYDQGSMMSIKLPDGGIIEVKFSADGVYRVTDPANRRTEFEYASFGSSQQILSRIEYPSGLVSTFEYTPIRFLKPGGGAGNIPAVEHFRHSDSAKNIYRHFQYIYGQESTNTYTGASIGCILGGSTDSLLDNENDDATLNYRYDVVRVTLDQDGKPIARSLTWFNNLHLAVEEINYLFDDKNYPVPATKTLLTYNITKEKRARATSYQLPTRTEAFRNASPLDGAASWQAMIRSDAEYNDYGNPIQKSEWISTDGSSYIEQSSLKTEYSTTAKGVQIATRTWNKDSISNTVEYHEQNSTEDGRNIASKITWFQNGIESGSTLKPWKGVSMQYDLFGRITIQTTAWAKGAQVLDGLLSSTTSKFEYSDLSNGILSKTEINGCGDRTILKQDVRRSDAPTIEKTLPLGQKETFEYDNVGRVIKHTDGLGQQTSTVYTEGPAGSSKTVTSPSKYSKRTLYDVLGREIEVSDNGDPTKPFADQPSRILSQKKYNCLSLQQEALDQLGRSTKYAYDALSRPITTTDVYGNIIRYQYLNGGQKVLESVNESLRRETHLDALARVVRELKFPDTDDQSIKFCIEHGYAYSGNGEIYRKSLSKTITEARATGSSTLLETEEIRYGPNKTVLSRSLTGSEQRDRDTVTRHFVLDLFDNHATYTKEVVYANGKSYTNHGPIRIYNEINKVAVERDQEGKKQLYFYDANGWKQRTVRFDGTEIKYTCDNNGQVTKIAYPSTATEHTFDAEGRPLKIREGDDTITYSRSLDGSLISLSYADGRTQSISLDKFSRTVRESDVFGTIKETEYNDLGLVVRRKCQNDTVLYIYGVANHTRNQYLGYRFSGSSDYMASIKYDGFGRTQQSTIQDPKSNKILLQTTYEYDARQKVRQLKSSSDAFPEQVRNRVFTYDGIGQMTQEIDTSNNQVTVTNYTYDGNSNVLSSDVNGQTVLMMYNKLDQRADSGFKYDTNGRLLQDNQGVEYAYDERDRLLSAFASSDTPTRFAYHSDSSLAEKTEGNINAATYYHGPTKINAVHETRRAGQTHDDKTSLFSDSNVLLAGYTNSEPSYRFLDQLGSTAVILDGIDAGKHASATYDAYGAAKLTPPSGSLASSFGFTQAFTDQSRGLIYLGSRFYNPKQMSFLTMDAYLTENRYAYCEGDPVNRIDPSGHFYKSWSDVLAAVAGLAVTVAVGAVFTAATGGLGAPVAAAVIGGAIAGTLGTATTIGVEAYFGREYSRQEIVTALLVGSVTGALSGGTGAHFQGVAQGNFFKAIAGGAVAGGVTSGVGESITMLGNDEFFDVKRLTNSIIRGAAIGVITGYSNRRDWLRADALKRYEEGLRLSKSASIVYFHGEVKTESLLLDDLPFAQLVL